MQEVGGSPETQTISFANICRHTACASVTHAGGPGHVHTSRQTCCFCASKNAPFLLHSMHGEKPAKIQSKKPGAELLVHQNHAHGLLDVLNVLAKQRRFIE